MGQGGLLKVGGINRRGMDGGSGADFVGGECLY